MQTFDQDQLHYIAKGQIHQQVLRSQIQTALSNNPFKENFIISSLPGMGKSYETESAIMSLQTKPLVIQGSSGIFAFIIDVATAVYLSNGQHIVIVLDDCDVLFEDKNINIAKKMFDQTRKLIYGKAAKGLKSFCTDLQWAAVESFCSPDRAGFQVPLNNVTFIILTNRSLPTVNEVEATEAGSNKESKLTDLYAIRRRTQYKEISMNDDELWGYVANVVLNEKICEKFLPSITEQQKYQILTWCFNNWTNVTERNLSLIEKMTKDIVRYPTNYLDIWKSEYL